MITKIATRRIHLVNLNFGFDLALLGLLIAVVITAFINIQLHVYLGIGMIPMLGLHLYLHKDLIAGIIKKIRQHKLAFRWKWLVDIALLLVIIPLILSGLIIFLIYAPSVSNFHETAFYVFGALILTHLFLSRKWLASKIRQFVK